MTYEEKLIQIRQDLIAMVQELIDGTEDEAAHVALTAVLAVNTLSNDLSERGLDRCVVTPVGKGEGNAK